MNSRETGNSAEDLVSSFLESTGYSILKRNYHFGRFGEIDIICSKNGIVVFAGDDNDGYGNKVIVYFGDNLYALYGHLEQISVETGSFVLEGEEIGLVGNTGNSSGNHLHFEIYSEAENTINNFNPLDYIGK